MPMNRVQFQPGLSLRRFLERYGSEAKCERALMAARWPDGFVCPKCGARKCSQFRRGAQLLLQCRSCRRQTSLTAGTPMAATKLPLKVWYLALYLLTQSKNGIAALELTRHLGVCYRSAWRIKHKLMEVMCKREEGRRLSGLVQIDDAYLGGERSGVPQGQAQWVNKVPFVAAVSTDQGRPRYVRFDPVSSFCRDELLRWSRVALAADAAVVSDGLSAFTGVASAGFTHQAIVVGRGRRAAQEPRLHWVNTVLSNLKTALIGTHHAPKFKKYARRYLAEIQYRFNRRFDLPAMLPRLAVAIARTHPLPERALRLAEERR